MYFYYFTVWLTLFLTFLISISITTIATSFVKSKLREVKAELSQNAGSKLKIWCSIQEGSKPYHFEWHRNGHPLTEMYVEHHLKYRIDTSDDESALVIDKLTTSDSANYTCTVRGSHGVDTQFTVLTVKGLHREMRLPMSPIFYVVNINLFVYLHIYIYIYVRV